MGNRNLRKAERNKNDEFYTQLSDIEQELQHYRHHFKDKVVYCNCDDPRMSNFFKYFQLKFKDLGLKKLIATCYKTLDDVHYTNLDSDKGLVLEYEGEKDDSNMPRDASVMVKYLKGDGDFRNEESIELLKEADIVVTNPPFSLFREYVGQLIEYDKKFIIIGNNNAITYKEIFPLLKDGRVWLGHGSNKTMEFMLSPDYEKWDRIDDNGNKFGKVPAISWFTNLDISRRHEDVILYKQYNDKDYPKYDNYDAINVDRVVNIPEDYDGLMGVPITFLTKHNPDQFEIIDALNRYSLLDSQNNNERVRELKSHMCNINGKPKYFRIIIKKRGANHNEDTSEIGYN